ncbi:MAG: hypothetical protein MJ252_23150, partial [archaeon]|nr:hypothetical protein [archaeon]
QMAYDLSIKDLERFKDVIPEMKKRSYASLLRELFSESVYELIFTQFPSTNDIQLQNYTKEIIQSRFIPIPDGINRNVSEIYIMQVKIKKYFSRKYSFKDLYAYVKGREEDNEEFYMMADFKDVFFYEKVITVSNMMVKNQMKFPEWCPRNEFQKVVEYVFKSIIASVDLKMDL